MLSLLRWLSRRPLRHLHALGAALGWAAYLLSPAYRARVRLNAALAGIRVAQRRQSVAEAGKLVMETLRLWLRPAEQPITDTMVWDGAEVIDHCLDEGRGLLLLTPHLGSFEFSAQAYAQRFGARQPITVLYRPARQRALRELEERARARPALATAPATLAGVRQLLRALRSGQAVGMLPDQVPPLGQGVWSEFFGQPAYTMTLAARLAQQTGAPIVLAWCERLPRSSGFKLHLRRLDATLPADEVQAAQLINRSMQQMIERCPEQYLWGYNRYKPPRAVAPEAAR